MRSIILSEEYLVTETGTSDGSQDKYYKDSVWYKIDRSGGEGSNEEIVSKLLAASNLTAEKYAEYEQIIINGQSGCMSNSFTHPEEQYVSIYRLYANTRGGDIANVLMEADPEDAIRYTLDFVRNMTGLDIREYIANTIAIDQLTLNTDRHMNNLGVIFNRDTGAYREAPIFDNGKAFFCGDKKFDPGKSIAENIKHLAFRPFSTSIDLMSSLTESDRTLKLQREAVEKVLSEIPDGIPKKTLEHQIENTQIKCLQQDNHGRE